MRTFPDRALLIVSRIQHEACTLLPAAVARQHLTPAEWACVPAPCPGLGAALHAVLARSEAEAVALVARLPEDQRLRLHTAVGCLRRVEHAHALELPPAILHQLLLASVE